MRRLVAFLIGLVPFDERGQRAIDETLRDWAQESATVSGVTNSIWVDLRAFASIVRAFAGIALSDGREVAHATVAGRLLLFVVLPCVAIALATDDAFAAASARGWPEWIAVREWAILSAFVMLAPLATFVVTATLPRGGRVPVIGLALGMAVLLAASAGWLIPATNQQLRAAMLRALTGNPEATLARGVAEMSPTELVAAAWDRPAGHATTALSLRSGQVALIFVLTLLGGAISFLPARIRRRSTSLVIAIYLGLGLLLGPIQLLLGHMHSAGNIVVWMMVATGAASLVLVRRVTPSQLQLR